LDLNAFVPLPLSSLNNSVTPSVPVTDLVLPTMAEPEGNPNSDREIRRLQEENALLRSRLAVLDSEVVE
jgi:hypothetical protein